jgi:hypothetical protein
MPKIRRLDRPHVSAHLRLGEQVARTLLAAGDER